VLLNYHIGHFVLSSLCVGDLVLPILVGVRFQGFSLQNEHHLKPAALKLQHTTNSEQGNQCGNSSTQSQACDDGYINVRNMLST
jgi:hypothetical protein